jgi:acetylornithine deacetylase/succinyl-diaminopimelate desuccinylase-like protein
MRPFAIRLGVSAALAGVWMLTASAQYPADLRVRQIITDSTFQAAASALERGYQRFVDDTIALTEVAAPPFKEDARAAAYLALLREAGLGHVERDAEGNVMGLRAGTNPGTPLIVVGAHLDTVFPDGTNVKVRRAGSRLFAPGIGDNAQGLALLLAIVRAMNAARVSTTRDILFVGNVGEEGAGDLRGMKYLFGRGRYAGRIGAFVSIDGAGGGDSITHRGVGTHRYRITFRGPGGHSYSAFGLVNPALALAGAAQRIAALPVPTTPKTTVNVGMLGGGTSVNAIPSEAWMEVDLRSESARELDKLDAAAAAAVRDAVAEENRRRSTERGAVEAVVEPTGARPSGQTSVESWLVETAAAVVRALGSSPRFAAGSTDANWPMSLGIPAMTIDSGVLGGRPHALDEWIDVDPAHNLPGMRRALLTVVALGTGR